MYFLPHGYDVANLTETASWATSSARSWRSQARKLLVLLDCATPAAWTPPSCPVSPSPKRRCPPTPWTSWQRARDAP